MLLAGLIVAVMFSSLRQMENWLHQHIFKVGWLITKDFQVTTILYYTFFLPGVVLYEVVVWLTAGMLNVRAERAIGMPEKQEIGELRLNFVKIHKKTHPAKAAIINIMPLLVGLIVIWLIADRIFAIRDILALMTPLTPETISNALNALFSTPDFWLWVFLLLTISNTMLPDPGMLKQWWRWGAIAAVIITIPMLLLGLQQEVINTALSGPVINVLNTLSLIFGVTIFFDLIAVAILGTIEALIERVTGASATFKKGKMIVMTREEAMAERRKAREKARKKAKDKRKPMLPAPGVPPSVYSFALPIPGPPGDEPVTSLTAIIEEGDTPDPLKQSDRPRRIEPDVITSGDNDAPREIPEPSQPRFNPGRSARPDTERIRPSSDNQETESEDEPTSEPAASLSSSPEVRFDPNEPAKPPISPPPADEDDTDGEEDDESVESLRPKYNFGERRSLSPRPFSSVPKPASVANDADDDDETDEADESVESLRPKYNFGERRGGLSPRPFSSVPKPTPTASDGDDDETDEDDELSYEDTEDSA